MKKTKIIGLLVACGGVVASFATAAALYSKPAQDAGFGIGARYSALSGTLQYAINGSQSGTVSPSYLRANGSNGGEGFSNEFTQVEYVFPLSATYGVNPQPYVVGEFEVEITDIVSALHNNVKVWTELKCNSSEIEAEYSGKWGMSATNTHFTEAEGGDLVTSSSYSVSKEIVASSSGEHSVHVYVKLVNELSDANMLALAETKPFDISVTWGEASSYVSPYIVGTKTQWEEDDAYQMVPNMKATSFSWWFSDLTGFEAAKIRKGGSWSSVSDHALDKTHIYNVDWDDNLDHDANFTDITPAP